MSPAAARRVVLSVYLVHPAFRVASAGGGGDPAAQNASAAVHGGDHHRWWCSHTDCYEHERAYVESCVVIMLLVGALVFEHAFHVAQHLAENSYEYGKLQELHHLLPSHMRSQIRHTTTPLFKLLVSRISGEFMVLGWLAFLIFVFRAAEGFEAVAAAFPGGDGAGGLHLPHTAEDWLHLVELVHMKLFMGMIIYFALITHIVRACVRRVATWEEMRILRRKITDSSELTNTEFRKYGRWRAYFILNVVDWRVRRPKLFQKISIRIGGADGCRSAEDFQQALDTHLAFSAYLSYAVREAATDAIDIHHFTWFSIIALFFVFALLHRFAHSQLLTSLLPIFICAALVLLFALRLIIKRALVHVEADGSKLQVNYTHVDLGQIPVLQDTSSDSGPTAALPKKGQWPTWTTSFEGSEQETFHEKHNTEVWILRTMQVILFMLSYSCARTIGDPDGWRDHPEDVSILLMAFVALFLVLAALLPGYIPDFAAVMALPPYVDSGNVEALFRVLDNFQPHTETLDSEMGICYQGSRPPKALAVYARGLSNIRGSTAIEPKEDQDHSVEASCARIEAAVSGLSQRQEELARRVDSLQDSAATRPSPNVNPSCVDAPRLSVPDDVDERQEGVECDPRCGIAQQMEIIRRELHRMDLLLPQVTRRSAFKVSGCADEVASLT